jgi:RNA polymerase sigma-70 factor, ECF subfamily
VPSEVDSWEAFRARLPASVPAEGLRFGLADALGRAAAVHPELPHDAVAFAAHIGGHLQGGDVAAELATMRVDDLLLAWAAGTGHPRAIAAFEAAFFPDVTPILARVLGDTSERDEVMQRLRERLFVGGEDRRPAALDYAGRGSLRNWVRVSVGRIALNLATRGPRETPVDDELLAALSGAEDDPELACVRARCRDELRRSFDAAARALTPRQRNLLRHAFVDGLGIDQVGSLYGVHRATAARWLAAARGKLLDGLAADLRARLDLDGDEVQSLLRWAQSHVELTLERCLATGGS